MVTGYGELSEGSSPLTRGALWTLLRRRRGCRLIPAHAGALGDGRGRAPRMGLIPAHAGSTNLVPDVPAHHRAHPRSRGEHCANCWRTLRPQGSSPLTRGALRASRDHRLAQRLIPAHAGSTSVQSQTLRLRSAHPRSRGEHPFSATAWRKSIGSSPLTRGALAAIDAQRRDARLIPAHAGSTATNSGSRSSRKAHPRSRGEHPAVSRSMRA